MNEFVHIPKVVGKQRAEIKFYEKCHYDLFMSGVGLDKDMASLLNLRNKVKEGKAVTYFLVTISYKKDVLIPDMEKSMEKITSHTWVTEYTYTYEFYDKEGEEYTPHIHMLIRKTKPKSHVIRELFSTLTADWYLDGPLVDAEHFIDVKPIKQFDYDKTLAYICKNRQKDVEARNDLSLEEIYTSSDYIEDYMLNHHTV